MTAQDTSALPAVANATPGTTLTRPSKHYGEGPQRIAARPVPCAGRPATTPRLVTVPGHPPAEDELEESPDVLYHRSLWTEAEGNGFGAPDRHAT